MTQITIFRVVVASPSDVMPERNALEQAINEINKGIAGSFNLRLDLSRWETDSYPGFHPEGVQAWIDPVLNIGECDIFIGIFWKRFGTPVTGAGSGTEHEFRKAYEAWKAQESPHIMFYFNQQPYTPTTQEEAEQWRKVLEFKESYPIEGLWWSYSGEHEFERTVRQHLTKFIQDYVKAQNDEEDEDDEPEILYSEDINLELDEWQSYECNMDAGEIINYELESDESINVMVLDENDFQIWKDENEVNKYYKFHEDELDVGDSFMAPENGKYFVVVSNSGSEETDVQVLITSDSN